MAELRNGPSERDSRATVRKGMAITGKRLRVVICIKWTRATVSHYGACAFPVNFG